MLWVSSLQTDKVLAKAKRKVVYFIKPAGVSLAKEKIDSLVRQACAGVMECSNVALR